MGGHHSFPHSLGCIQLAACEPIHEHNSTPDAVFEGGLLLIVELVKRDTSEDSEHWSRSCNACDRVNMSHAQSVHAGSGKGIQPQKHQRPRRLCLHDECNWQERKGQYCCLTLGLVIACSMLALQFLPIADVPSRSKNTSTKSLEQHAMLILRYRRAELPLTQLNSVRKSPRRTQQSCKGGRRWLHGTWACAISHS